MYSSLVSICRPSLLSPIMLGWLNLYPVKNSMLVLVLHRQWCKLINIRCRHSLSLLPFHSMLIFRLLTSRYSACGFNWYQRGACWHYPRYRFFWQPQWLSRKALATGSRQQAKWKCIRCGVGNRMYVLEYSRVYTLYPIKYQGSIYG